MLSEARRALKKALDMVLGTAKKSKAKGSAAKGWNDGFYHVKKSEVAGKTLNFGKPYLQTHNRQGDLLKNPREVQRVLEIPATGYFTDNPKGQARDRQAIQLYQLMRRNGFDVYRNVAGRVCMADGSDFEGKVAGHFISISAVETDAKPKAKKRLR